MANISNKLLPATYNGVPFLMSEHKQTGLGRKTVVHDFPFQDTRYIEDLGQAPRVFDISAIISDDDGLYFTKRLAFEQALGATTTGILTHPFAGVVIVRLMENYTLEESSDSLSTATYRIKLGETINDFFPAKGGDIASRINSILQGLRDSVRGSF